MRNALPKNWPDWQAWQRVVGNSHKALAPGIILDLVRDRVDVVPPELVSVQSLLVGGVPIWADDRFAHSFLEEAQPAPGRKPART